ncbi:ShlB/FhaC/HecB family hemolysin secretion/activation protein [Hydrogenophaga sp.]|uniref:ShlB/FhaC/HecB family hemolysin secretion/activation protein n=1 Tax=Hydrogenophaga sp. TaxID=1904254 RepID=UPI003AF9A71F
MACTLALPEARAQSQPNPALVMQEQLRRIESGASTLTAPPQAELPAATRSQAPEGASTARIQEIQFSRSELLNADELRVLAQPYVGRALTTTDLQQLLDAIATLYQSRNVLTAVGVLPQQDLQSGLLRVLLVEGRLGEVNVKAEAPLAPDWIKAWFTLPTGQVIGSEPLRKRLVLFNLASDHQAQAQFVPGVRFGVSDLAVEVVEQAPLQTWAMVDTYPGQAKTKHSMALGLRLAPVTSRGGRLDAAVLGNADGRTLTGSFSMPIGVQGWRAGINAAVSRSDIRVQSVNNQPDLLLQGSSESVGAELERTWVLAAPWLLTSSVSLGSLRSKTDLDGVTLVENELDKLAVSVRLSHETATSKAQLRISLVTARRPGASHGYLDMSGQWRQAIDTRGLWQFRAVGILRTNERGLPGSSDAFSLGGQESLRGFDANTVMGSSGHGLQLEFRRQLLNTGTRRLEGMVFLDTGRAREAGMSKAAAAVGVGIQAQLSEVIGVDVTLSRQMEGLQGDRNRVNLRLVGAW